MGWCAGMAVACAGMRSGGVSRENGGRSTAGLTEGESTTLVTENKDRMGGAGGEWVGAVCRHWRLSMCSDYDSYDDRSIFADPGGRSSLRRATSSNPRNKPCPTCGAKNVLTQADVNNGYQCNRCADSLERGF